MAESRLSTVLLNAATRIETDGLNKGSYFEGFDSLVQGDIVRAKVAELRESGARPKCDVFGALFLETEDDEELGAVFDALAVHGFGQSGYDFVAAFHMTQWADDPELTAEDATGLLRRTAEAVK